MTRRVYDVRKYLEECGFACPALRCNGEKFFCQHPTFWTNGGIFKDREIVIADLLPGWFPVWCPCEIEVEYWARIDAAEAAREGKCK